MTLTGTAVYTFIIALTVAGETQVIEQHELPGRDDCVFVMGSVAQSAASTGEVGEIVTPLTVDEDNDPFVQFTLSDTDGLITLACIDTSVEA